MPPLWEWLSSWFTGGSDGRCDIVQPDLRGGLRIRVAEKSRRIVMSAAEV